MVNQPYLLLQAPSGRSYRFNISDRVEWKVGNDDEWFRASISDLYPDANALRLGDWILQTSSIQGMRFPREERLGLKNYCRFQGALNILIFGGAYLVSPHLRDLQGGFLLSATGVSAVMVLYGSYKRRRTIDLRKRDRYVLKVAGGPLLPEPMD